MSMMWANARSSFTAARMRRRLMRVSREIRNAIPAPRKTRSARRASAPSTKLETSQKDSVRRTLAKTMAAMPRIPATRRMPTPTRRGTFGREIESHLCWDCRAVSRSSSATSRRPDSGKRACTRALRLDAVSMTLSARIDRYMDGAADCTARRGYSIIRNTYFPTGSNPPGASLSSPIE